MMWSVAELNHAVFNICLFPPLFFFYGLYYTDVWSVFAVLTTIQFYQRKWRKLLVAAGIAALFFRQTNIFWVAIYLGGSEVFRQLKRGRLGIEYPSTVSIMDVVTGSRQHSCYYDPLISQASFEGMELTKAQRALIDRCLQIILSLHCPWPQRLFLGSLKYFLT